MPGIWELTPRQSVEAECQRRGKPAVVDGCVALLEERAVLILTASGS